MNLITIEIRSWDKHQKRKDVKHPTWFALSNSVLDDPMFTELKSEDIVVWVYILALASKAKSSIVTMNIAHGVKSCRLKKQPDFLRCINALIKTTCIKMVEASISSHSHDFTDPYTSVQKCAPQTLQTDTTDITGQTSQTEESAELGEPSISAGVPLLSQGFDVHRQNQVFMGLISEVSIEVQISWLAAYPDADWIVGEVLKANAWIAANPKKRPKKFGVFMTNWLSRGYESYRKGIPSRRMTNSELNAMSLAEMHDKVQKGEL